MIIVTSWSTCANKPVKDQYPTMQNALDMLRGLSNATMCDIFWEWDGLMGSYYAESNKGVEVIGIMEVKVNAERRTLEEFLEVNKL